MLQTDKMDMQSLQYAVQCAITLSTFQERFAFKFRKYFIQEVLLLFKIINLKLLFITFLHRPAILNHGQRL